MATASGAGDGERQAEGRSHPFAEDHCRFRAPEQQNSGSHE